MPTRLPHVSRKHESDVDQAFELWCSANDNLARVVENYLAASTDLCDTVSSSGYDRSSHNAVERALFGVDPRLKLLLKDEERLQKTRITLAGLQNTSQRLSHIGKLPLETLSWVFTLTNRTCLEPEFKKKWKSLSVPPVVLAGVCSRWRHLALHSPLLWTHINIVIGSNWEVIRPEQTEFWAQRSPHSLLEIHLWELDGEQNQSNLAGLRDFHISQIIAVLTPLMPRALDFCFSVSSQRLLDSVVENWINHSCPSLMRGFHAATSLGTYPLGIRPMESAQTSTTKFDELFRRCCSFTVDNCITFPGIAFHEGLTYLCLEELDCADACLTYTEVVSILAACPRLRNLMLCCVDIQDPDDSLRPIDFDYLESLTLRSHHVDVDYQDLLLLLNIRSNSLNLSLGLSDNFEFVAAAKSFFSRTKITTLHLASRFSTSLNSIFCSIPHLRTMAIENGEFTGKTMAHLPTTIAGDPSATLWPSLHTLYLICSVADGVHLQRLVQLSYPLLKVRIYKPRGMAELNTMLGSGALHLRENECAQLAKQMHTLEDFMIYDNDAECPITEWDFANWG